MMARLKELATFRLLMLLALAAIPLSAACWAGVVAEPFDENGNYREEVGYASGNGGPYKTYGYEGGGQKVGAYDGAQGIHVRATGTASGTPDLAVISLGVESVEDTAAEARSMAADAMAGVMDVLAEAEIEDRDIQTQYFNISPRYRGVEVTECDDDEGGLTERLNKFDDCITYWDEALTGYAVSNQLSVKIRDLDQAGTIIDQVTAAAGDQVRVNGIRFTIENADSLREQARSEAMAKLQQNAEDMAELAGVGLGRLVHLTEHAGYIEPLQPVYARAVFEAAESMADTSISAGELDVSVSVSGVYLITKTDAE